MRKIIYSFIKSALANSNSLLLRHHVDFYERGGDLDILVDKGDMKLITARIIKNTKKDNHLVMKIKYSKLITHIHVLFVKERTIFPLYFEIRSVINDYIIDFSLLKKNQLIYINKNGFYDFEKDVEGTVLLIRNFLAGREESPKHRILLQNFSKTAIIPIAKKLGFNANVDENDLFKFGLTNKSKLKRLKRRIYFKIFNKTSSTPQYICFYGPDGSGKSTYVKLLYDELSPFKNISFFHYFLTDEQRKKIVQAQKSQNNFNITNQNPKLPLLRFLNFNRRNHIGFFKRTKNDILVLNDRFILDYFLKLYKNNKFKKSHALVGRFFANNKKYLNILLVDTPENIIERKNELEPLQISSVYSFLRMGLKKSSRYIEINMDELKTIENVYSEILTRISCSNLKNFSLYI